MRHLSHSLVYSAQQLETAYTNNIIQHFSAYVKRFVVSSVRYLDMSLHEVENYSMLPVDVRRACDQRANNAFIDIIERRSENMSSSDPIVVEWIRTCQQYLLPSFDAQFAKIDDHLEATPFVFLPYMIKINLLIEALPRLSTKYDVKWPRSGLARSAKLYSPLVLRTSFVPTHMTIDTTALLHIFVDDICRFKAWYYKRFNVQLLHLLHKQDLAASFSKLVGRKTSDEEDAEHAERCWMFVMMASMGSRLKNQTRTVLKRLPRDDGATGLSTSATNAKAKKNAVKIEVASKAARNPDDYEEKALRFQRMVMTDGYNLSILMTTWACCEAARPLREAQNC
jgi:hypothetical protein